MAPIRLPTLVPTTRSMGIFSCSSARITPTWAKPRAAPPPSTRAILGFGGGRGVAGAGDGTGGGTELQAGNAARLQSSAIRAGRIPSPFQGRTYPARGSLAGHALAWSEADGHARPTTPRGLLMRREASADARSHIAPETP